MKYRNILFSVNIHDSITIAHSKYDLLSSCLSTHNVSLQIVKKGLQIVSNPKLPIPSHSSLLIRLLLNMSLSTSACFFYFLIFSCFLFLCSQFFFPKKIRNKFLKTLMMGWHPSKNYLCLNITRWDYPTIKETKYIISVHNVLNKRIQARSRLIRCLRPPSFLSPVSRSLRCLKSLKTLQFF